MLNLITYLVKKLKAINSQKTILLIGIAFLILSCSLFLISFFWLQASEAYVEKFYDITKNDPIFYDAATDQAFLTKAVEKLQIKDDQIVKTNRQYQKNSTLYPAEWRLWPDDFLGLLPAIHQATNTFFSNPTKANAENLIALQEQAATSYEKAINLDIQLLDKVLKLRPDEVNTKIIFLGSATTPDIVRNDFFLIRQNAEEIKKQVMQRKQCLQNGKCDFSKIVAMKKSQDVVVKLSFQPLPDDILGIDRASMKIAGPYWATTGCFGFAANKEAYNYPFYIKVMNSWDEYPFLKPLMSNTKYYRDYQLIPNRPISQEYLKRGLTIVAHPEVNDYFCSDLRYIPNLFVQYLAQNNKNISSASQENKLFVMPYLIQETLSFSTLLTSYMNATKTSFDPLYYLIDRSAYSLYFGTFSPSIWRLTKEPTFLLRESDNNLRFLDGYITYEDLINRGLTKEQIKKFNDAPTVNDIYSQDLP